MKISLLSNINLDSLARRLTSSFDVYTPNGYGLWRQELIAEQSQLYLFDPECIFILLDGGEITNKLSGETNANNEIDEMFSHIESAVQNNSQINFFVSTIDVFINKIESIKSINCTSDIEYYWMTNLRKLNALYNNFFVFDLKNLVLKYGRNSFYSSKLWYLGSMRYSMNAEKILQEEIGIYIKAVQGKRKKCLILDLDNTLWGGVIGEDSITGIKLGNQGEGLCYKDFQSRIKELKDLGVLLAIVSKNNYEDAYYVMEQHSDMILRADDFVASKINWDLKSNNIRELSNDLNIGLDSFVYIDDSSVERAEVSFQLNDLIIPEFPLEIYELESWIINVYKSYFFTSDVLLEDKKKTLMYQQNYQRSLAKSNALSFEDFIESLKCKITLKNVSEVDIDRIIQLVNKTNQFNLTTKRYTKIELLDMINSNKYELVLGSVQDRFGDNGIVVFIVLNRLDDESVLIESFLMSCRVMGRHIEDSIISFLEDEYSSKGYLRFFSKYIKSNKNNPVSELFERLGYDIISSDSFGSKKYVNILEKGKNENRKNLSEIIRK